MILTTRNLEVLEVFPKTISPTKSHLDNVLEIEACIFLNSKGIAGKIKYMHVSCISSFELISAYILCYFS